MSEAGNDAPAQDQLFIEAAGWFARMRGPEAEASRAEFERWLARGALHRAAYNRAAEVFALGKLLQMDEERAANPGATRPRPRRKVLAATLAGMLALAGAGSWLMLQPPRHMSGGAAARQTATLTSRPGEQRHVRLADGSIVKLQPGTRIVAAFDGRTRRLTLERGRALFEVAHQSRAFVVHAGGGSVTARGTAFEVALLRNAQVSVRLIEGLVDVRLPAATGAKTPRIRQLQPGQSLRFAAAPRAGMRAAADLAPGNDRALPEIPAEDFRDVRVADLIARANLDSERPIRISAPEVGERRVTGRFRVEDPEKLAERIALLFDLVVDRSAPGALVLRRN